MEKIAQAKAEIFDGLEPGGIAILNKDNRQFDLLRFLAATAGVSVVQTFGEDQSADSHTENVISFAGGSSVDATILGTEITYKIGAPGKHQVKNSLAVLTAVADVGADLAKAGLVLDGMRAPKGRGEVSQLMLQGGELSLIDESYNANPASMRAAIAVLGSVPVARPARRIAVIGDMRELGTDADRLHADLLAPIVEAQIDAVYCVGPHMHALWEQLPHELRAHYCEDAKDLEDVILKDVRPGDVVMIKGSLGTRMGPLVTALKKEYPPADDTAAA